LEILCKNSLISIFSFFLVFSRDDILSYILILLMSQLQTQKLMTSQIRSHIEYFIRMYNIFVLIFTQKSKFMRNVAALAVFNTL